MPLQTVLTISAASVGFVAAIFFCFGAATINPSEIVELATGHWDRNNPVVQSLISQKAQYLTGGVLLVISFGLQIAAIAAKSEKLLKLPQGIRHWRLALLVVLATLALGFPSCAAIERMAASQVPSLKSK